jgi:hypothetical protein
MSSQMGISSNQAASEVDRLRKSLEEFAKKAGEQTNQMLRLTRVLTGLTAIMTVLVGVQIYLIIFK